MTVELNVQETVENVELLVNETTENITISVTEVIDQHTLTISENATVVIPPSFESRVSTLESDYNELINANW